MDRFWEGAALRPPMIAAELEPEAPSRTEAPTLKVRPLCAVSLTSTAEATPVLPVRRSSRRLSIGKSRHNIMPVHVEFASERDLCELPSLYRTAGHQGMGRNRPRHLLHEAACVSLARGATAGGADCPALHVAIQATAGLMAHCQEAATLRPSQTALPLVRDLVQFLVVERERDHASRPKPEVGYWAATSTYGSNDPSICHDDLAQSPGNLLNQTLGHPLERFNHPGWQARWFMDPSRDSAMSRVPCKTRFTQSWHRS